MTAKLNQKERGTTNMETTQTATNELRPVVVTTEHRGVFFGYIQPDQPTEVENITITQARNCVYWSEDVRGFMGLAATGPTKSCKIGPAVPELTLRKVTAVVGCTPEAAKAWEVALWAR